MYVFNRVMVNSQLPKRISKLSEISNNLWRSWNTEFLRIFQKIDVDVRYASNSAALLNSSLFFPVADSVELPCSSISTSRVLAPCIPISAARLTAVVVLATPPLVTATVMTIGSLLCIRGDPAPTALPITRLFSSMPMIYDSFPIRHTSPVHMVSGILQQLKTPFDASILIGLLYHIPFISAR